MFDIDVDKSGAVSTSEEQRYRDTFVAMENEWAQKNFGVPLFVGEFNHDECYATVDNAGSPLPNIDKFSCQSFATQRMNASGFSWAKWTYKSDRQPYNNWGLVHRVYTRGPNIATEYCPAYQGYEPDMNPESIREKWVSYTSTGYTENEDIELPQSGTADLVWRSGNTVSIWRMLRGAFAGYSNYTAGSNWIFQGAGDFDANSNYYDDNSFVWRDSITGDLLFWRFWYSWAGTLLKGESRLYNASQGGAGTLDWAIVGISDMNNDRHGDIVWRKQTGEISVWLMNGQTISSMSPAISSAAQDQIVGIGDFTASGSNDILWRSTSGSYYAWNMSGGTRLSTIYFPTPPSGSTFVGIGDFNNDDSADLVWRSSLGSISIWWMNPQVPGTVLSVATPPLGIALSFQYIVSKIADVNGDRMSDFVLRNSSTSEHIVWLMGVSSPTASMVKKSVAQPENQQGWTLLGAGHVYRW